MRTILQTNPEKYSKFCTDRSSLNTASTILRSCFPIADTRCLYLYIWIIFATFILSNFALFHFHFYVQASDVVGQQKGPRAPEGSGVAWGRVPCQPVQSCIFRGHSFPFFFRKLQKYKFTNVPKRKKRFPRSRYFFAFRKFQKVKSYKNH